MKYCPAAAWCEVSSRQHDVRATKLFLLSIVIRQTLFDELHLFDDENLDERKTELGFRLLDDVRAQEDMAEGHKGAAEALRERRDLAYEFCELGPEFDYVSRKITCRTESEHDRGYTSYDFMQDLFRSQNDD